MKLCILSNSHATSLKDGLESDPELASVLDCTFFAAPKSRLKGLEFDEYRQALVSSDDRTRQYFEMTSGGLDYIPVDAFDAFFIYGLFFTLPRLKRFATQTEKKIALDTMFKGSIAHQIARKLATASSTSIIMSPEPWRTARLGKTFHKRVLRLVESWSLAQPDTIYAAIEARGLPDGVSYLWQDAATLTRRLGTRPEFGVGSRRLTIDDKLNEHLKKDRRHMNGQFGAMVLRHVAERLGALPPRG